MLSNSVQVERAEKNLMDTRKQLAGMDGESAAQKASGLMFKSFEDSIKLFIESIKYQDPMDPVDTSEMAKQMFQLSQAQGMHSMNEKMEQQIDLMRSGQVLSTSSLIGKMIELDTNQFSLKEGENSELSFTIPRDISKAKLEIVDKKGGVVYEKEYTPPAGKKLLDSGQQRINWSGEVNTPHGRSYHNGQSLKEGDYKLRLTAYDSKGEKLLNPFTKEPIEIPTTVKARLTGSDFSQKVPKLLVGNDQRLPLSSIVSIQEDGRGGSSLVDRVNDVKESLHKLSEEDQREVRDNIKKYAKENRKTEKKAERFERRVNDLTPNQFEELKRQFEEKQNT